jgi:hypothetical protein
MTVTKWARLRCRSGSGNVEVRTEHPPLNESIKLVCIEADTAQLTVEMWDELVRDVNELLGRDEGSVESAAGGS